MTRTITELAETIITATETVEQTNLKGYMRFYSPYFERQHLAFDAIKAAVRDAQMSKRQAQLAAELKARGYAKPVGLAAALMSHIA